MKTCNHANKRFNNLQKIEFVAKAKLVRIISFIQFNGTNDIISLDYFFSLLAF